MKNDFEERRERRLNTARHRAAKNEAEAGRLFQQAGEMAGRIPMGQPILVGHHSEKRDRNYRARIDQTARKSIETQRKADFYADKADSIENNTAIFSDDPQALQKLTDKLNGLKTVQEFMKAANHCIRKDDREAFLQLEMGTPALWGQLNVADPVHGKGFPRYQLTNNNANIRRIAQRVEQLQKTPKKSRQTRQSTACAFLRTTKRTACNCSFRASPPKRCASNSNRAVSAGRPLRVPGSGISVTPRCLRRNALPPG